MPKIEKRQVQIIGAGRDRRIVRPKWKLKQQLFPKPGGAFPGPRPGTTQAGGSGVEEIPAPPPELREDFIANYTEVDTGGHRTVNQFSVQVINNVLNTEAGYVYRDLGAGNIGDFTAVFKTSGISYTGSGFQTASYYPFGVCNVLGGPDIPNNASPIGDFIGCLYVINAFGTLVVRPVVYDGGHLIVPPAGDITLSHPVDYWVEIIRAGTSITFNVYSDADLTTLVGTYNTVLGGWTDTYRYAMVAWGSGNSAVITRVLDILVEDLILTV